MSDASVNFLSVQFEDLQEDIAGPAKAFLVGAGPGDPGLITRRGAELLKVANVVLFDRLVADSLLELCQPGAERICVQSLEGTHPQRWPEICRILVEKSQSNRVVVRLKGGDPFLFGRGAEECEALLAANIPYEVVPGVSSGLGGPAWAGIPVTHRDMASSVAFVTAHELGSQETRMDWKAITAFPGTLVFFMPLLQIQHLRTRLLNHGMNPELPAALIERGTLPDQKVVVTTLDRLVESSKGLKSPTLIVVGHVVGYRNKIGWSEKRPLAGMRILLTRPETQAAAPLALFARLGAFVENQGLMKIGPSPNQEAFHQILLQLSTYDWVVFNSPNGVRAVFNALKTIGKDARALGSNQIACIGPSTANCLGEYGINADIVPGDFSSSGLVNELGTHCFGKKVLIVRADRGSDILPQQLSKVATVHQVKAYSHQDLSFLPQKRIQELANGKWDWVVLGSSSIAQQWAILTKNLPQGSLPKVATISPATAAAAEQSGLKPIAIANEFTFHGISKVLANHNLR